MRTAPTFAGALRDLLLTQIRKHAQVSYIKKMCVCVGGGFGQFLDLTFYLLTVILIPVQLPYGVVLVSDVQYSDSTTATAFL